MMRKVFIILWFFECYVIGYVCICIVVVVKYYLLLLSLLILFVKKYFFMCSKLCSCKCFFLKFDWICVFFCIILKKYYYVFGLIWEVYCFDFVEVMWLMFCLSFDFYRVNIGWVWVIGWFKVKMVNFFLFFLVLV